jgi:hypothetical protein
VESVPNRTLRTVGQKPCERKGIPPATVVGTIISFGVTLAITTQTPEDAAKLLEAMASAIRRGQITSPEH